MKKLMCLVLIIFLPAFAGMAEFGAHGGLFVPSGDNGDAFSMSPALGINVLAHLPTFAVEGSISYVMLQPDEDIDDFSGSIIPVLVGLRSYSGPVFYGGGAGLYMSSVSVGSADSSDEEFGVYGNIGMIFPTGSTDIEGSIKYHLIDFDTDKGWIGLTVGLYF